jgi:hypothetical protein
LEALQMKKRAEKKFKRQGHSANFLSAEKSSRKGSRKIFCGAKYFSVKEILCDT